MATRENLTIDFDDLLGAEVSRISARLMTNLPSGAAVMDETNKTVNLGSGKVDVGQDGKATLPLILTDSTDLNIAANTLQYRLLAEATVGGDRVKFDSGWFAFTAAADITELDLQQPALIPSGSGSGSSSLIVVSGGTVDLPDAQPDGYLIGYKVTATTTIEGVSFAAGSYIFERDSGVTSGWTFRTLEAGEEVTVTPDTTAPTAPTLTVDDSATTELVATFSGGTDNVAVTQYRTRIDAGAWTVGASPRTFAGLTAATSYTIDAQAGDAAGNWSPSATWTGSTAELTYAELMMTHAPDHFWPLAGSGEDVAGTNDLTLSGGAIFTADGLVCPTGVDKATGTWIASLGTTFTYVAVIELAAGQVASDNWMVIANGNASFAIYNNDKFATGLLGIIPGPAGTSWPSGKHALIALKYTGTAYVTNVNGVDSTNSTGSLPAITGSTFTLGGTGFVGKIKGVAILKDKVLTAAQLLALAQARGLV